MNRCAARVHQETISIVAIATKAMPDAIYHPYSSYVNSLLIESDTSVPSHRMAATLLYTIKAGLEECLECQQLLLLLAIFR
jgi:hypothetical protein